MKLPLCTIAPLLMLALNAAQADATPARTFSITAQGAIGDARTLNTKAIQAAIDQCAAAGGGTVVVPKGEFLSGALYFKAGVNLTLAEGAVLEASPHIEDFPILKQVRFEGHFQDWVSAFLNVEKCDHFHLTGPGALLGNGEAYWKAPSPNGRPRLCAIRDSKEVVVSGVDFKNSPSWNLHLYDCQDSTVENCRFEAAGPSTDGVDVDSSQNITVNGCYFAVNDDCVCLKGNRYDGLNQEPKSPPVSKVTMTDCTFVHGMGALTLGTEATGISDVEMKDCTVNGKVPMLRMKLRPDTAGQDYNNVRVHDIQLDGVGPIVSIEPNHGTKVQISGPVSSISNITVANISGTFGSFGSISGAPTGTVSGITFRNVHVKVSKDPNLNTKGATDVKFDDVIVRQ
jgi:polygalacturonase